MSSEQNARVCTFFNAAFVSDKSQIYMNDARDGDVLKSGVILKEMKIPVYFDINIIGSSIIIAGKSPVNPYIKVLNISRRYIYLISIENNSFWGNIKVETENGVSSGSSINIRIGYGEKTDQENKEYCQELYNSITKLTESSKPEVVETSKSEVVETSKSVVVETSKSVVEATKPEVEASKPEVVEASKPEVVETFKPEVLETTNTDLLDAYRLIMSKFDTTILHAMKLVLSDQSKLQ